MLSKDSLPFRLYGVTDRSRLGGRPLAEALEVLGAQGLRGVQLREKDLDEGALEALAAACRPVLDRWRVVWLVNGPAALAERAGAPGVHVTASGDVAAVRSLLGPNRLVGQSAHGVEDVRAAARGGADFVVVGPVFATPSKAACGEPLGLEVLRAACAAADPVPVFAIGGVTPERARACRSAGAAGVAAQGPLMQAAAGAAAARDVLARYADALGGL